MLALVAQRTGFHLFFACILYALFVFLAVYGRLYRLNNKLLCSQLRGRHVAMFIVDSFDSFQLNGEEEEEVGGEIR